MMEENERLQMALHKRKQLERELRDAEILLGLIRKNLQAADEYIKQIFSGESAMDEKMPPIRKISKELELDICERWKQGERSFMKIGIDVGGLAAATIKKILITRGLYKPHARMTDEIRQQIIERFNGGEGESVRSIAKDIGYSVSSCSKVLKSAGFETNWVEKQQRLKEDGYSMRRNRVLRTMEILIPAFYSIAVGFKMLC